MVNTTPTTTTTTSMGVLVSGCIKQGKSVPPTPSLTLIRLYPPPPWGWEISGLVVFP